MLNPFAPPLHYETDLPKLLAAHETFWYITCNTGVSIPVDEVLQGARGWMPSGMPVRVFEPRSPIIFKTQKYVRFQ